MPKPKNEKCAGCVFLRHTWDKGGMPTIDICHGRTTTEEAYGAIDSDECDEICKRGHQIKETGMVDGLPIENLPTSKEYLVDPFDYSETPVAICDNALRGMKVCSRGEDQYCYCKLECTSQMDLDNPKRMAANARKSLVEAFAAAGIDESQLQI